MLVLNRSQTRELLALAPCIEAVERAFALHGARAALGPSRMHVESGDGVFHVTGGGVTGVFGLKLNGRFPPPDGVGGQRVSGAILLQDASDGRPLALLDSQVVTVLRTAAAAAVSDVVVTVTPATAPVLHDGEIAPGCLVVALGADGPGKQELDPRILARSKVVVDVLEQAASSGELAHALAAGLMTRDGVHAELGEVVAGVKPGRVGDDETIVFDATGTALQDVAAAQLILEAARSRGAGVAVELDA